MNATTRSKKCPTDQQAINSSKQPWTRPQEPRNAPRISESRTLQSNIHVAFIIFPFLFSTVNQTKEADRGCERKRRTHTNPSYFSSKKEKKKKKRKKNQAGFVIPKDFNEWIFHNSIYIHMKEIRQAQANIWSQNPHGNTKEFLQTIICFHILHSCAAVWFFKKTHRPLLVWFPW